MNNLVSYPGKIVFEPENKTKKHELQATWKKVAMVVFDGDVAEYYAWFLKKRFGLKLNKPLRGAHISFINDRIDDINHTQGTLEEKDLMWQSLKEKWDGKDIEVVLNLDIYSDKLHWWLIVDHGHRDQLHTIRAEIGLDKPFFGLHMSIGYANEYNLDYSEYLNLLHEKNIIELNKKYEIIK